MSEDLIQKYIDRASFAADTKFAIEQLAQLEKEYTKLRDFKISLTGSTGTKDIGTAAQNATKQVQGLTTALQDQTQALGASAQASKAEILSLEQNIAVRKRLQNTLASVKKDDQENLDLLRQGVITQDEYKKRVLESAVQQEKLSARISEANKGIKDQIKLQNTPANTIARAQAENKQLVAQRNVTPVSDVEGIAKLNEQIDRNNDLIDLNNDKLGKQKINIGNYQGSANTIIDAYKQQEKGLQSLNTQYTSLGSKIENQKGIVSLLAKAGGTSTTEYKAAANELGKLSKEYSALTPKVESARTVVEGFRRVAEVSAKDFTTAAGAQKALSNEAKNIGAAFGTNSEVFKEVNKVVGASTIEFNNVSKAVDASGKNANNAGGLFKKAFGGLRTLANIIPGIGISGLLLFAIDPIIDFIKFLTKAKSALFGYGEQLKLIKKINDEASTSGGKAIADLEIQRAAIESILVPMKTRLQAIKDLKEEYPSLFKNISTENLLNGQAADAYNLAAAAIIRKARAQAAASEIEKLEIENLKIQQEQTLKAEEVNTKVSKLRAENNRRNKSVLSQGRGDLTTSDKNFNLLVQPIIDDFKKGDAAAQKIIDLNKKKENFLIGIAVSGAEGIFKIDKEKKEAKEKSIADLQKQLNTEFDLYKLNQARLIELYKEEAEDQKLPLEKRLDALNNFFIESKKLIGEQEEFDRQAKQREAQREIDNLNKDKKGKNAAQIARINQNISIIESNLQQDIKLIEAKGDDERIKAGKTFGERRAAIVKSNSDKISKIIEDTFKDLNTGVDKEFSAVNLENEKNKFLELQNLDKDFIGGKLKSTNDYEAKKAEIEKRYTAAGLQAELNAEEEKKVIALAFGRDTTAIDEKILQLKLKQLGLEVDATRKAEEEKARIKKEIRDKERDLLKAGADAFIAIVQGQFDRDKNRLADEQLQIDTRKERELAANDALVQSEEKKAANIAIINARAQSQREALDRRQKQIDRDRAIFDRAVSIAEIVANTARAVVKDLVFNKALIPLDIAIGAAQLAAVLARPIPRFKTGKNNDYEGPAIVGDGGVSEYIERADGSLEKTPAKDTLTYLGKSDIVHPDLMSLMMSRAMPSIGILPAKTKDKSFERMENLLQAQYPLLNKIANKRENHLSAKDGALVSLWKHGSNTVKYFEENTNW